MSLSTQIQALVAAIAGQFNTVKASIGNLANLNTAAKSSIVAAINELESNQANAGAQIDDTAPSTSTVYSSSKTENLVATSIANVVAGAPESFDTLKEIADKLAADDGALDAIMTALALRVRVDAAQTFDNTQQAQARTNIGAAASADVGDTNRDFVADFNNALAA